MLLQSCTRLLKGLGAQKIPIQVVQVSSPQNTNTTFHKKVNRWRNAQEAKWLDPLPTKMIQISRCWPSWNLEQWEMPSILWLTYVLSLRLKILQVDAGWAQTRLRCLHLAAFRVICHDLNFGGLGDYLLPWSLPIHEFCQKLASVLIAPRTASYNNRDSEGAQEERLDRERADSCLWIEHYWKLNQFFLEFAWHVGMLGQDSSVPMPPRMPARDRMLRADIMGHSAVHLRYSVPPGTLCEEGNTRDFKYTGFCFFWWWFNVLSLKTCTCYIHAYVLYI